MRRQVLNRDLYQGLDVFAWRTGGDKCTADTSWGSYATHSMVTDDDAMTPYPSFYTYALFNKTLGSTVIDSSSSSDNVRAIATTDSGNAVRIIVTNLNSFKTSVSISIQNIADFEDGASVDISSYTIKPHPWSDGVNASQISWNGVTSASGLPGPYNSTNGLDGIPSTSSTAIISGGTITLSTLPAHSIVGLVVSVSTTSLVQ